jgi:hypothetical protein
LVEAYEEGKKKEKEKENESKAASQISRAAPRLTANRHHTKSEQKSERTQSTGAGALRQRRRIP